MPIIDINSCYTYISRSLATKLWAARHIPWSNKSPQRPRFAVTSLFLIPILVPYLLHIYTFARVRRVIMANGRRNTYICTYTSQWWSAPTVKCTHDYNTYLLTYYNFLYFISRFSLNYYFLSTTLVRS